MLSQKNYRVIKTGAQGESKGFWFLFIPFVSPTYAEAKEQLYRSVGLDLTGRAVALANQTEDNSSMSFIIITLTKVTLTADVVEFVKPLPPGAPPEPLAQVPPPPRPYVISADAELRKAETEFRAGKMSLAEFRSIKKVLQQEP